MIVHAKKKYEIKKARSDDWHAFWCIKPRWVENHILWLSRAERRIVKLKYDGASGLEYPIYEYRLINWISY